MSRRWTYGSLVLVLALLVALPLRLLGRRPAPRHPAIRRYADRPPKIRLCPGLTIVTAVSQPLGDYESIKTVESIADGVVHLKYSSERTVQDLFDVEPHFERLTLRRGIRLEDVRSGTLYLEQFYPPLPEVIPGTTAIGTSAALLDSLKTKGEAPLGIFLGFNGAPGLDRSGHPTIYDFAVQATVRRVEVAPVMIPVLVDGGFRRGRGPGELVNDEVGAARRWRGRARHHGGRRCRGRPGPAHIERRRRVAGGPG